ncbi:TMhelix containing protein [Vibrio phage Seahorse]|uniref:TMhelix containing protein n=1 Tax=Vibrio phage Seahorse TaxID=2662136 RepID=A0A6B7SEV0_9CAUD|nr:TMhelix containing protein [Vibrio phage Seahorse]QGF21015.1 TMhelix containing protein [Vibrio phage Seahorse]
MTEILGGLAGVVILVLSMMVKSSKSDKKAAELERDQAVQKAQSTQKRVEAHEKREEIEQDIAMGDLSNTDGLHDDPYNRDSRS